MLNIKEMLEGSIHRMSHVYRYSSIPTIRRENVAEHSWYVAMYSYLIARDLEESHSWIEPGDTSQSANIKHSLGIDMGKLLSRAILHDIDESMTGDFLRIVKYGEPGLKQALDNVSRRMIIKISDELSVNISDPWETSKAHDLEGGILELADLACVVSYIWEEFKVGNRHLVTTLNEVRGYYIKLETKLPDILKPYAQAIVAYIDTKRDAWQ